MTATPIEPWRRVCREGWLPLLQGNQLDRLQTALALDSPQLCQGQTTDPPPIPSVEDWPVAAACPVAFPCWQGGASTVAVLELEFAQMCHAVDQRLGEPAGVRHLLNWVDDTPRAEVVAGLLAEVEREVARRECVIVSERKGSG